MTDEEIKAMQDVVDAARRVTKDLAVRDWATGLESSLQALDALRSPLPSREEMASAHDRLVIENLGPRAVKRSFGQLAEAHWADCLRWVAEQMGTKDLQYIGPSGMAQLEKWAEELESR